MSWYQKGKTSLDFTEARDSEWQWHQLYAPRSRQITMPTPHQKSLEKPRNYFFHQNGSENYFRFRFSDIFLFSTLHLVFLAKNLEKFLANFSCFERPKVCAFISQKLNKLCRPFFTFPDNFCCSIRIWKNILSGIMIRGLQCPKDVPKSQNFKIFTFFARLLCPNALCQQFRTDFFLYPTGPSSDSPYAVEGSP